MAKQSPDGLSTHLNSAGYTIMVLGLLATFATIGAFTSTFAWLQGKDQISRLETIANDTRALLAERIQQNDEQAAERAAADRLREQQQERANEQIAAAIERIQLNTATSVDCLYWRDHGVRPPPCKEVNDRTDRLRGGLPLTTTQPSVSSTTTTTRPTPTSTTTPSRPTPSTTTPCRGINLLGICIGG